jgi:NTE family protein
MIVQDTSRPFRGEWPQAAKAVARFPSSSVPSPDRVVTLLSLAERLPDRFIAETLAQSVRAESGGSVLLIHLDRPGVNTSLKEWAKLHPTINGDFALTRHVEQTEGGISILRVQITDEPDQAQWLPSLLRHCAQHYHYLILRISLDVPMPLLLSAFAQSDRAFLLLRSAAEDFYQRDLLLREVRLHPLVGQFNLRTIVCRERGEARTSEVLRANTKSIHGLLHDCPSLIASEGLRRWPERNFNADVRRLAREICRCRVGLALSSGGARGLAHVGILQVLEENGVEIDYIAGCSMGSYVGAVWAYGFDGVSMERLAREVEHKWGLFEMIDPYILPRRGFLRGEKTKQRLKRSIGDAHFSELIRPLRIVATHLHTLERIVFASGEVAEAVQASSAIPGACVPIEIDGELFIDGGIADPLPVDVLEELGVERIIAVNTIPPASFLRAHLEQEKERAERLGRRGNKLKMFFHRHFNYFAPGNVLDTLLRSFNGAQMRVAEYSCLAADLVLRPLSYDGRWHDFRRPGKYIAIGRREAEEHIEEIKALVNRKQPLHELTPAHHALASAT